MNSSRTRRLLPAIAAVLGLAVSANALAHPLTIGGFHGAAHFGGGGVSHFGGNAGWHGGWGWHGGYNGGWRGYYGGWRGYYGGWGFFGAGLYLATLPWYYSTYYWDGIPYYYADNTYYRWNSVVGQYESVRPVVARAQTAAAQSAGSTDLFMYPKSGQSTEQQERDRYECHRWAADQTGFDPTQTGGGVAANAAAAKRADYLRADGACLEGRHYSVR